MKRLRFYKEPGGAWYIDLPEWKGDKADLLMVAGADTLLDVIADGGSEAELEVRLDDFPGSSALELRNRGGDEGGGHYYIGKYGGRPLNLEVWLCDVTEFIFGNIPERICFTARR